VYYGQDFNSPFRICYQLTVQPTFSYPRNFRSFIFSNRICNTPAGVRAILFLMHCFHVYQYTVSLHFPTQESTPVYTLTFALLSDPHTLYTSVKREKYHNIIKHKSSFELLLNMGIPSFKKIQFFSYCACVNCPPSPTKSGLRKFFNNTNNYRRLNVG